MSEEYLQNYNEWKKIKNPPKPNIFTKTINWIKEYDDKVKEMRKHNPPPKKSNGSVGLCIGLLFIFTILCLMFGMWGAIACVIILLTLIFGQLVEE